MRCIDFHTHAFPDSLAARAVPALEQEGGIKAVLDGTLSALVASMDSSGIECSVVCSIATKPDQFEAIMKWSRSVASARIVPLPSIHPADPLAVAHVGAVAAAGFKGIKLHPYYQNFSIDSPEAVALLEAIASHGLLCVCHTGFDIAFPRERRADPAKIAALLARMPDLKFVATHLGAWQDWDEVDRHLLGRPIYMETSFAFGYLDGRQIARMLRAHPAEYLLFGSDSPWQGQAASRDALLALGLGEDLERRLFYANAEKLLA